MNPEKWIGLLLQLWERSVSLLGALAAVCAATCAILAVCWFFEIGGAAAAFPAYGPWLAIGAFAFGILSGAKIIEQRLSKTVHLMADDRQSFWSQTRQTDGEVTTQFVFRMRATNLTDKPILLSTVRLLRPRIRRRDHEIARHIFTRHPGPNSNLYGSEYPISPGGTSSASSDIIVDRPIGRLGQAITAVVAVSDQFGRWHKVKFEKLRCIAHPDIENKRFPPQ